jgi:hypothetical protein
MSIPAVSGQCRDGQGLVAVLLVDAKKPDRRCGRSACRWQPERPRAYDLGTAARSRPTDPADLIVRLLIFITVVLRRIRQVDPQMRVMRNGPVGLIWRNANVAQQSSLQDCCAMTTAKRNRTFRARPTQAVQQQARSPRVRGEINVRYKQAGLRKTNALLSISKACQAGSGGSAPARNSLIGAFARLSRFSSAAAGKPVGARAIRVPAIVDASGGGTFPFLDALLLTRIRSPVA